MKKLPSPEDIKEMKARGYDRVTIVQEEERMKRGLRAEHLCREIEAAFEGVTLGNGIGLTEAQGLDDYADADTCAYYRANDEKEDWRRIPVEALNKCNSSLCFFDGEGMRFHLPAYLIAELRGEYGFGLDFNLTHFGDHVMTQFELLNDAQRQAVRHFLLFIVEDPGYEFGVRHIKRALESFWIDRGHPAQP